MRLTEAQGGYLEALLRSRRHVLIVWRRGAIEGTAGVPKTLDDINEEVRFIDHMLREIERCADEKGWRSGQL